MTTEQIRIRMTTDEMKQLKELADESGLQTTALVSVFVRASMAAIKENHGQIVLPLRFKVESAPNKTRR